MTLCLFHINKNVVKLLISHHLSKYIKKCTTEIELWTYSKFRQILCLPFLPLEKIPENFDTLKHKIISVLTSKLDAREIENLNLVFSKLKTNYYHNETKLKAICKFGKFDRTTNPIEGGHSGFNKSSLVARTSNLNSMVQGKVKFRNCFHCDKYRYFIGLMELDAQFRAEVVSYNEKGYRSLPHHKLSFVEREKKIKELNRQLSANALTDEEFLQKISDLYIHKNWFHLVKDAVAAIDGSGSNESEDPPELDEFAEAIFIRPCTAPRIRNLSKRYFGNEWLNNNL